MRTRDVVIATCLLLLGACGKDTPAPPREEAHSHPPAPHGGEVLGLSDDEYHLEMIHDHDGGNVTVYVLGKDLKTPVAVAAPVVNLNTKTGPVQVTLTALAPRPDGTSDGWKGSHEGLKADPWDGRIRVVIAGKTYQSPLEAEAHTHE
jgi:hypothetical protein